MIICLECYFIGMKVVSLRFKYFDKDFMAQFKAEHAKAFPGEEPQVGGWPDFGDGRYSEKLTYKQWHDFNTSVRAHYNIMEQLPMTLIFILLGGLVAPTYALPISYLHAFGRIVYAVGYSVYGAKARMVGQAIGVWPLYFLGCVTTYRLCACVM